MRDVNAQNFGYVIAFLLPGFIVLAGLSVVVAPLAIWLGANTESAPTIGGFLYSTLFAVGAGVMASTVRWLIIDTLHHWTGIREPRWRYSKLQENSAAFEVLKQDHYRFYQCYGNCLVALCIAWVSFHMETGLKPSWADPVFLALIVLCYLGSRDTLRKYYARVRAALA